MSRAGADSALRLEPSLRLERDLRSVSLEPLRLVFDDSDVLRMRGLLASGSDMLTGEERGDDYDDRRGSESLDEGGGL